MTVISMSADAHPTSSPDFSLPSAQRCEEGMERMGML